MTNQFEPADPKDEKTLTEYIDAYGVAEGIRRYMDSLPPADMGSVQERVQLPSNIDLTGAQPCGSDDWEGA